VRYGGTSDAGDWHRRLLERMGHPCEERLPVLDAVAIASLQELLRFRHRVRHLYAYDLQPEPVERLRTLAIALSPKVRSELNAFQGWLTRDRQSG
jgi:hypothetical protein